MLQQSGVGFKGDGENEQVGNSTGFDVFFCGDPRIAANFLLNLKSPFFGALEISRSDDDDFTGLRPAQRQSKALWAGASEDSDGPAHANSGSNACSTMNSSGWSLILIRV